MKMSKEFVKYLYFNFSGVYNGKNPLVNLSNIPGTNCYCDDTAKDEISRRLDDYDNSNELPDSDFCSDSTSNDKSDINALSCNSISKNYDKKTGPVAIFCKNPEFFDLTQINGLRKIPIVRFIDSGNYHYMSLFFMKKVQVPFILLLLDNHPDTKPAAFGGITSCGGWVREAAESFPKLDRIIMAGVDESLLEEESPLPDKVITSSLSELPALLKKADLPLYISLDKDIMSEKYARTDWSQGSYSIDDIICVLRAAFSNNCIIGFDICGEKKENPTDEDIRINEGTNEKLLSMISSFENL